MHALLYEKQTDGKRTFIYNKVYGSNGAETMRVGTSQQAYSSSNTVIENNLFERCSGEVEVISIKSSDNIIRNAVGM